MHEIERKFLLRRPAEEIVNAYRRSGHNQVSHAIRQTYLDDSGEWTIRFREQMTVHHMSGRNWTDRYVTMKRGISMVTAIERELKVEASPVFDNAFDGPTLTKVRHDIILPATVDHPEWARVTWQVDVFTNSEFKGLEIAEIELTSEDQSFERPDWLGEEVTHDKQYKNVRMWRQLCKPKGKSKKAIRA